MSKHARPLAITLGLWSLALLACQGPNNGGGAPTESLARPQFTPTFASPNQRGPIEVPIANPDAQGSLAASPGPSSSPSGGPNPASPGPSSTSAPTPTPTPPTLLGSVAGDGSPASQDGAATPGRLFEPVALVVEANRVLVAEAGGHRVVAYTAGPPTSLKGYAGSGLVGSQDGLNLKASFTRPAGLVAGAAQMYYLADAAQAAIRELRQDGAGDLTVRTLAGGGVQGHADGSASDATFSGPQGLAYRDQQLYVADAGNHCIRRVDLAAKPIQVSTFAGTGVPGRTDGQAASAQFREPVALAWSPSGELLVCDAGNHSLRGIAISPTGSASTVRTLIGNGLRGGGDGDALGPRLADPQGVAVDAGGAMYVADTGNHRVVRLEPGGKLATLLGDGEAGFADGVATAASLNLPSALAFGPDGRLWLTEAGNHRLRVARP